MIPPVVVGAVFLATGLLLRAADVGYAEVLTTTLVLVVIVGSVFPWMALGATGTRVDQLFNDADITADPDEIDAAQVAPTRAPPTRSWSRSPRRSVCCWC